MKKKTLVLALLAIMLAMPMMTSLVEATEWVEVTRFTGSGTTDYFICEHVEWRIRWEYTPSKYAVFSVFTYDWEEDVFFTDSVFKMGDEETSGVSYIHNQKGTFYMKISATNIENFTVIVEQDVDSIPEFTPATLAIVLIAVSVLAVALSKKVKKRR